MRPSTVQHQGDVRDRRSQGHRALDAEGGGGKGCKHQTATDRVGSARTRPAFIMYLLILFPYFARYTVADIPGCDYYRIGEAKNPGPLRLAEPAHAPAPDPPPVEAKLKRKAKRKVVDTNVESVNGSSWHAIFERLMVTDATIICGQEHRLPESAIAEKSATLAKMGWKSLWAPAVCTNDEDPEDLRNYSGGTVIIVKDFLGLAEPMKNEPYVLDKARLVAGKVSVPGTGSFVIYSAYFTCGAGWDAKNEVLANVNAKHAGDHKLPWLVGADWNMEPTEIHREDLPTLAAARIIAPVEATCVSPACSRVIDYFLCEGQLAEAVTKVETVMDAATRPHRPVQATIKAGGQRCNQNHISAPGPAPDRPHHRPGKATTIIHRCQAIGRGGAQVLR